MSETLNVDDETDPSERRFGPVRERSGDVHQSFFILSGQENPHPVGCVQRPAFEGFPPAARHQAGEGQGGEDEPVETVPAEPEHRSRQRNDRARSPEQPRFKGHQAGDENADAEQPRSGPQGTSKEGDALVD